MNNPLLDIFNTPFDSAPFLSVKNEYYKSAFEKAIEMAKAEINEICNNSEIPTFENTIEAMEISGERLSRISSIFFNLNSAETNDEMQQIAQEISPLLSEFSNDIRLNPVLFERIKSVYDQKFELNLSDEQFRLLEKKYKNFSRNGANLSEDKKEKLREIDKELSSISLQFGQNVLAETNAYELHLTNENELKGLPDYAIQEAKKEAESKEKTGWIFTLQATSYLPFMTYNDNRNLREMLFLAYGKRSFQNNEFNNEKIVKRIVELRLERAKLLEYKTHADFVLEERMANSPQIVKDFLLDLLSKSKKFGENDVNELKIFAQKKDNIETLQRWDHAYYAEKLKQEKYSLSEEELKPYFSLENVVNGTFTIAERLFGIRFEKRFDIQKYHEDVEIYEVSDKQNNHLALFYTDFFPRKGKRAGAWMTEFRGESNVQGNSKRPHISIVCNFTKPTKDKPSLLTFNEVTTLFHEFGHALHGMLANTVYESLSGTNVYYDFVELPSQFMENFCYEPEALELFAQHYKTGETIPQELIEKVKKSSSFMEGYQTVRQLSFGLLDMAWHGVEELGINSVSDYERKAFEPTELYPIVEGTNMSVSFSHIFHGGYSSGYYSYKWSEVLEADAFAYFQETGIFNSETAKKFKHLLESGGSIDPMELYKSFRGKEPSNDALLKRAGFN
ncbi:M3 family metallopeptidase [Moheibacter sediminis]|uniref:oligopeptidase A n=1 Tax=Moheibacter sediminis TaxID=1434700 RepID=A0A1W1ZDT8_9FLAO|nr:M3 family metallopeptidase [Moheibacter sediminis]SMC46619.1 peptidyl-dipeptidase Dcp [Moheibacter sediminis]